LIIDIGDAQFKLEKGLKALDFLDNNMNIMSKWLTEVEQKLDEIEDTQFVKKNLETQITFIKVKFITSF